MKIGLCVVSGDLGEASELVGTGLAAVGTAMAVYSEEVSIGASDPPLFLDSETG